MKNLLLLLLISLSTTAFGQWEEFYVVDDANLHFAHLTPKGKLLLTASRSDVHYQKDGNTFGIYDIDGFGFLSSMAFENEKIGYIGGGCYYTFDECLPNTLYKTTDGGESWTLINQYGGTGVLNSISVVGDGEIFALSDYDGLVHSTDGGQSWNVITVNPNNDINQHGDLTFINSKVGYLSSRGYLTDVGNYRKLYKTIDGGQSWSLIYDNPEMTKGLMNFFFIDEYTGYSTHPNAQISKTTDGGLTWTKTSFSTNTDEAALKIVFPTAKIGYLISGNWINGNSQKGKLYRTDDGGLTWALEFQNDEGFLNDIDFIDAENGYLIASPNKVYKRTGIVETTTSPMELEIFPNPAKNQFNIKALNLPTGDYQLNVLNMLGQVVITTNNLYAPVNIQKLDPGAYIVEIKNQEGTLIARSKLLK